MMTNTVKNSVYSQLNGFDFTQYSSSSLVGNPETDWYVYAIRTLEGIHKELE